MPSKTPPKNHHFLGLELSTEQLRAVVVDEYLDVVVAEQVDFDMEMPEYQCVPCSSPFFTRWVLTTNV